MWRSLLLSAPQSSVVVLAGSSRGEFLSSAGSPRGDFLQQEAHRDTTEFRQEILVEQEATEDNTDAEPLELKYVAVEEENKTDLVKTEPWSGSESLEKVTNDKWPTLLLLDRIPADFCWPPGLEAPNLHRMRWRHASWHMLEVRGNKSLFATLTEACPEVPQSAAFSLEGSQVVGVVSLKDFVNGQAYSSQPAFQVDGVDGWWSVDSLLGEHLPEGKTLPETVPKSRKQDRSKGGDLKAAYSKVHIYYGSTGSSLWSLTQLWKKAIKADWQMGQERRHMGYSQKVVFWMEQNAPISNIGGRVCVYCGMDCREGGFITHMNIEHLFNTDKNNKELRFECYICKMVVGGGGRRRRLHMRKMHAKVALSEIPFENRQNVVNCPICKEDIIISLQDHWHQYHDGKTIACELCPRTFTDPLHFGNHMRTSNHYTEKSGACRNCSNKVYSDIKKHQYTYHSKRSTKCIPCNKTFINGNIFDRHRRKHRMDNGELKPKEKQQCPECHNVYQYLEQHVRRFHEGKKTKKKISEKQQCLECHNFYQYLEQHVERFHRGKKTKKKISANYNDKRREREWLHVTFQCGMCNKEFKRSESERFNGHLREMHFSAIFKQLNIKYLINTNDPHERETIGSLIMQDKSDILGPNEIQCKFCTLKISSMPRMLMHMKSHLGYKRHEVIGQKHTNQIGICPKCGILADSSKTKSQKHVCVAKACTSSKAQIMCWRCNDIISDSERPFHEQTCSQLKSFMKLDSQRGTLETL